MSDTDDYIAHARQWWRDAKKEHPVATTVAQILPVTGQVAAVADYADDMEAGNTAGAVADAVSLIPGVKLAKVASKLAPASLRVGANVVEKSIAPITKNAVHINRASNAQQAATAAADYADEWRKPERGDAD